MTVCTVGSTAKTGVMTKHRHLQEKGRSLFTRVLSRFPCRLLGRPRCLAFSLLVSAVRVAVMEEGDRNAQEVVAEVVFADADVLCFPKASSFFERRLNRFGYRAYSTTDACLYCRKQVVDCCDDSLYVRCDNRVLGVTCGDGQSCRDRVKQCKVEGLVTCDDELSAAGRMECSLYPETQQGLINRAAECRWSPHRKTPPPAPSCLPAP